jgi:tetratricopeptide (TPR) repeat protein
MDSLAAQDTRNFASPSPQPPSNNDEEEEDDNPLGILAGPARPKESTPPPPPSPPIQQQSSPIQYNSNSPSVTHGRIMLSEDEEDEMMAQLIDMGFSLQESKFAIEATGGNDVQAAIDLLVQNSEVAQRRQPTDQHGTAQQQKAELSQNERARNALFSDDSAPRLSSSSQSHPQQQKQRKQQQHPQEASQKNTTAAEGDDTLHHQAEKVVMQAQELGGFLYKNATSFLKTGREKVTKAVGDWQEQQREQRLRQMQEEQGGPVRPKWMNGGDETVDVSTNNIEKFADDEDSDNEQDIEAERRKIQEMRRLQELKRREQAAAAHKARQQQNLRKETLIAEEEVYISPSRRRGNTPSSSGKSTPRSNGSPVPQPQQIQQQQKSNLAPKQQQQQQQYKPSQLPNAISVTPGENKRTRPVVNASADIMAKANEARNQGNEKFKLGQFGEAEEAYTRAIEILPAGHDHQVLLCNNRAMARLKIGNYKKCAEDCDTAIKLAKKSGDGSSNSEGVVIQWRDQIIKSLYRKAEALENIEKYKDALSTYDELVKYEGTGNSKINQGMSRCRQALNPKKVNAPPKSATPAPPPQKQKKEDFMSMFDPSAAKSSSSPVTIPTVSADELSKSKAVAAMRAKAAEQEAEDAEKLEKTDDVNARLLAWKAGKEQNLRALLATLDTLLWPGAQWKGAQMSELINLKKCKITYMKAIGKVHPDKVKCTFP